jgi:hypothetical protein
MSKNRRKSQLPFKSALPANQKFIGALKIDLTQNVITVDGSKLESPQKAYSADTAWATYRAGQSSLFFATRDMTEPERLPSRLEVRMPPEDFLRGFLWNSRDFLGKITDYAQKWGGNPMDVEPPPTNLKAIRTHSEWANFMYVAHAGTETSLDFYQMSVSGVARFAKTKDLGGLSLTPVVRVHMSVFELISFMRQAFKLEADILRDAPEEVRQLADQDHAGDQTSQP